MVVPLPVWKLSRFVGPSESSVLPSVIESRSVVRGSRQPRAVFFFFSYSICSALLSLIIFSMINSSSSADPEFADAVCVCVCVNVRCRRRVGLSPAVTMMDTLFKNIYFLFQCAVVGGLCVFAADGLWSLFVERLWIFRQILINDSFRSLK